MAGKRKPEIRILTLFLAMVLTMTSFSSAPVYAAEKTAVYTTEGKSETLQVLTEEEESSQEDVSKKELEKIPEAEEAETIQLEDPDLENKENENGQEEPRAPTEQTESRSVTLVLPEHGQLLADTETAVAGTVVTVTAVPDEGYQVMSFQVLEEDGTAVKYLSEDGEEAGTMLYQFEMPDSPVTVTAEMSEIQEKEISVSGEGAWIEFQFDQLSYTPGGTVTAILTPETGYDIQPDSIKIADLQGMELEYELNGPDEQGSFTLTFQAAETDMLITAEAVPREQYAVTVTTESLEEGASVFETSVEPMEFYEGTEVTVHVEYSGDQIWTATVTSGEENTDLDFQVSSSAVTFTVIPHFIWS